MIANRLDQLPPELRIIIFGHWLPRDEDILLFRTRHGVAALGKHVDDLCRAMMQHRVIIPPQLKWLWDQTRQLGILTRSFNDGLLDMACDKMLRSFVDPAFKKDAEHALWVLQEFDLDMLGRRKGGMGRGI